MQAKGHYGKKDFVMKRFILSSLLVALTGAAYADIQAPPASEYTATRKLGRAVDNILLGVSEIPTSIYRWESTEGNTAGCTVGVIDGVSRTAIRMGYGFYELVTFWAPTYKCTYRPPYQGSCGRSGLKEYNVWSGFAEFPEEIGFESKYNYSRASKD